jgi:hypothetical protein
MVSNGKMFVLKNIIKSSNYMKSSYGGGVPDTMIPKAFVS